MQKVIRIDALDSMIKCEETYLSGAKERVEMSKQQLQEYKDERAELIDSENLFECLVCHEKFNTTAEKHCSHNTYRRVDNENN